jgi:hypothetical protein
MPKRLSNEWWWETYKHKRSAPEKDHHSDKIIDLPNGGFRVITIIGSIYNWYPEPVRNKWIALYKERDDERVFWEKWFNLLKLAVYTDKDGEAFTAARSANHLLRVNGKRLKDIPTKIYFDIMMDLGGFPKKIRGKRFRNIRRPHVV